MEFMEDLAIILEEAMILTKIVLKRNSWRIWQKKASQDVQQLFPVTENTKLSNFQ